MPSSIFRAPAQMQIDYFRQQTGVSSTSSLNEMIVQRFVTLLGVSTVGNKTLSDLVNLRLNNLGYSGPLGDKLNDFFRVKSGTTDRVRAEQIFFSNVANNFT